MNDQAAPRPKPRRARGLLDRRGPGLAVERELIQRIAKVYEDWGFEPLETPAFEYADALGKFLPDQDRPNEGVFAFEDDEEWVALRYDLTAPLARFVAENFDALPKPYRRWAAGPVWRNEKPGPGRYREFWQCDADTVGSASPAADAEMIAMACAALEAAGIKGDYVVKVSSRKLLDGVLQKIGVPEDAYSTKLVVLRAIDKFDRLGVAGVEALLGSGRKDESGDFTKGAGLSATATDTVLKFINAGRESRGETLAELARLGEASTKFMEGFGELNGIDEALVALGVSNVKVQIDPSIVRGLEYYTGAVFEAQLIGGGATLGSIGGGGRYDDLVARFRGERIPATGFSIGVSRLAAALQAQDEAESDGPVVVLVMDQARVGDALAMADELRRAGVRAEAYLGAGGMKAQLKYADKRAAPVAVIQGGDELAKGVVTLKDLKLGAKIAAGLGEDREAYAKARAQVQQEVPRAQLVAAVQQMLAR
jgi:histidyl-tRNA synthetase